MVVSVFDRVNFHHTILTLNDPKDEGLENYCGKAFSPFPTMFSKAFFCMAMKTRDCFGKD